VVVSALLWGGHAFHLLQAARYGRIQLFASVSLHQELEGVLSRPKFQAQLNANALSPPALSQLYAGMVTTVDAPTLALAAKADVIVTGDEDLLTLSHFQNIWIAKPRAAVAWLQIPV